MRILDLTRLYPGPLAAMFMADLGAEVIKIEDIIRPDSMRSYPPFVGGHSAGYLAVNRSKQSLALKLNDPRGQEIFFRLVKTADVVIEQFRPGVLDEIGLGYTEAIKTNPGIIYVSLSGYGQKGPYAQKAGHDINYAGYAGLLGLNVHPEGGPVLPGAQIADVAGGAYMAIVAVLAALRSRDQDGLGQQVDVSMLDGTLPLLSLQLAHYWATGRNAPSWQLPLSGGIPGYGLYQCRDGNYIALGALESKFWAAFCRAVEKPAWIEQQFVQGEEAARLKAEVARLFLSKDRAEWLDIADQENFCLTPVWELPEIERDPHVQFRGMIVEQHYPEAGPVKSVNQPLKFSRSKPAGPRLAPSLGQHTREILSGLGYDPKAIEELRRAGVITQ